MLAFAFALVPVWLAVITYRDARRKDEKLFETTTQVLTEQYQRSLERHIYPLNVFRSQARSLDDAALARGKMMPVNFDWKKQVPHFLAFGYAERVGDKAVLRWLSEARATVAIVGDDLASDPRVLAALNPQTSQERGATMGCVLDHHRLLLALAFTGPDARGPIRGFVVGWVDLEGMCRDSTIPFIKDRVLDAVPLVGGEPTPAGATRVVVRDGSAEWSAGIARGEAFGQQVGAPIPWVAFIALGLSTVPLVLLTLLARRAANFRAALTAEREVVRQQRYFTQSVSHEFRTPLGIILSGADLLESYADKISPERRSEVLAEIKENTQHMNEMIEGVLLLGRIDSQKLRCDPKPVNVLALCQEIAGKVMKTSSGGCEDIEVHAPDSMAMLDAALLVSILGNLLSNAVKYSPTAKAVELDVTEEQSALVFCVRDHGIGIPPEELARICDPFHRCGNVGEVPGTGLGLAIVQRCTTLHGGTLKIESRPERGTVATVTIPYP